MNRYLLLAAAFVFLPGTVQVTMGQAPHSKTIARSLQPFVDQRELAGAVTLVANSNEILAIDSVGYADISTKLPMQADTLFWIASMTKPITCVALMMLVEEGKLKLDDPISKSIPEFDSIWIEVESDKSHVLLRHPQRPVSVRDILRHTSGLPFRSPNEDEARDYLPLAVSARYYANTRLLFEPGTRYLYSSAGINLVGRLIEIHSGMPYEEFLTSRLLKPIGMADTTFWPTEAQLKRLAKAYKPNKAKNDIEPVKIYALHEPYNDRSRRVLPGGGLFSTAIDLARFCQMMLNQGVLDGKRYLSVATVAEMTKRQTDASIRESYGLGFTIAGNSFGHGGAYATNMSIDPKRGLITIYLVQHNGFLGDGSKAHAAFRKAANAEFAPQSN